MSRLANKGFTARAPQTAQAVPELPDFDAQFASLDGGQRTNAALQNWWDVVRQRIEFTNGSNNNRMREFTASVNGLTARVTEIIEVQATADEYLEASWTMEAAAGPIVTGMKLFSASGPGTTVSYIAFQADRFQVNTASGGNKEIFSATATEVKLGDVLTVDLTNSKVFIGTGTYNNSNTAFYVDDDGFFSLKGKLRFDPTGSGTLTVDGTINAGAGSIGGWTINSTTIAQNNAILDSAGQLILGTSNDVIYISATDSTYRVWIGNATAGSAAFRVTKTGIMTAVAGVFSGTIVSTSGTIADFTLSSTTMVGGSGTDKLALDSSGTLVVGDYPSGQRTSLVRGSLTMTNSLNNLNIALAQSAANGYGFISVANSGGGVTFQVLGNTGATSAGSLATAHFDADVTTAVDVMAVHLRVFSDTGKTTQTFRVDSTNGYIYVQNVQVVRNQYGTPYPGGGADAAGLWAKDCLIYHGLGT